MRVAKDYDLEREIVPKVEAKDDIKGQQDHSGGDETVSEVDSKSESEGPQQVRSHPIVEENDS